MYNLRINSVVLSESDIQDSFTKQLDELKNLTNPSTSADLSLAVIKGAY